jgi:hypothetical protein
MAMTIRKNARVNLMEVLILQPLLYLLLGVSAIRPEMAMLACAG